jgi:hypothetical protein
MNINDLTDDELIDYLVKHEDVELQSIGIRFEHYGDSWRRDLAYAASTINNMTDEIEELEDAVEEYKAWYNDNSNIIDNVITSLKRIGNL